MLLKFYILMILISHPALAQSNPSCIYSLFSNVWYICDLTIDNPNGFDGFTNIEGQHLPGFNDNDVHIVSLTSPSITAIFPSIICNKFESTDWIFARANGIQVLSENSFRNCSNLKNLEMQNNRIAAVDANVFANNVELTLINLHGNSIRNFGSNIFTNLVNLRTLLLGSNNLDRIPSNWFGHHPNLRVLHLQSNLISSIDERIFDINQIQSMNMTGNFCANEMIFDEPLNGEIFRTVLRGCFDNFNDCAVENLEQKICDLDAKIIGMEEEIRELRNLVNQLVPREERKGKENVMDF